MRVYIGAAWDLSWFAILKWAEQMITMMSRRNGRLVCCSRWGCSLYAQHKFFKRCAFFFFCVTKPSADWQLHGKVWRGAQILFYRCVKNFLQSKLLQRSKRWETSGSHHACKRWRWSNMNEMNLQAAVRVNALRLVFGLYYINRSQTNSNFCPNRAKKRSHHRQGHAVIPAGVVIKFFLAI